MAARRGKEPARQALAVRVMEMRRAVLRRLGASETTGTGGAQGDNTPFGDVLELVADGLMKEIEAASRETLLRRLQALDRACQKVRAGTYGACEGCGRPIPRRRLEAIPEALLCAPCQEERERAAPRRPPALRMRRA